MSQGIESRKTKKYHGVKYYFPDISYLVTHLSMHLAWMIGDITVDTICQIDSRDSLSFMHVDQLPKDVKLRWYFEVRRGEVILTLTLRRIHPNRNSCISGLTNNHIAIEIYLRATIIQLAGGNI